MQSLRINGNHHIDNPDPMNDQYNERWLTKKHHDHKIQ